MSDTSTAPEATENDTTDSTDWKAHARKWEDRAKASKKEADDLRAKVQAYESTASTSQTELEKLQTTVAELTAKSARNEREALIARIARDHKIDDGDDIELFLTGADEATLTAQAARLATRSEDKASQDAAAAKAALHTNAQVPSEGQASPAAPPPNVDLAFAESIRVALGQAADATSTILP